MTSCKKEVALEPNESKPSDEIASNRAPVSYGVTLYDGVNPCRIIEMDNATGNVLAVSPPCFYIDNSGATIALDNIKGICLTSWGQYFLTTGTPANPTLAPTSIYNNALFKVNPATGQCSYASTNFNSGTVSDLEHDPQTLNFYGLRNNSNSIIEIVDNNNNYGTYNGPFTIFGIDPGYVLKGLTMVRDGNGMYLVGCATNGNPNDPAKLYEVPANGGLANFLADLDPINELAAGHCGIGFDIDQNLLFVNRNNTTPPILPGLNYVKWNVPLVPITPSFNWWGLGFNFEDLTSDVQ
ncbi:MAG: hypothetical protein IT261_01395 [Saprospiraceae bacterium]|nr:hypothetical protein [Saprospiraceae bacterium]